MMVAAEAGLAQVVKLLLEEGAHLNVESYSGYTPLSRAALRADESMVRFMLQHDSMRNPINRVAVCTQALPSAACAGEKGQAIVRLLLNNGAKVNKAGDSTSTALYWAVLEGQKTVVNLLLEHGAKLNPLKVVFDEDGNKIGTVMDFLNKKVTDGSAIASSEACEYGKIIYLLQQYQAWETEP